MSADVPAAHGACVIQGDDDVALAGTLATHVGLLLLCAVDETMTRLCAVAATATGRVGRFSIAFLLRSGGGARPWNGSTGWHARGHGRCLARGA